jgi:hypothetical protein
MAVGVVPAGSRQRALATAAVEALRYYDVFDWPLTAGEIHRALPVPARRHEVHALLADDARRPAGIVRAGGLYALAGSTGAFARRERALAVSARLWPHAERLGRRLARMPWVQMVAVTGSLAVGAATDDADIDLFVVTADGRLWLTRALTIATGRTLPGEVVPCPNYLLAASALALPERDRFTAHELAQLVPLHGADTYHALLVQNAWYREHLPNHSPAVVVDRVNRSTVARVAERVLGGLVGDRLERWERQRKIARLAPGATGEGDEVRFGPDVCKGHFEHHRDRVLAEVAR